MQLQLGPCNTYTDLAIQTYAACSEPALEGVAYSMVVQHMMGNRSCRTALDAKLAQAYTYMYA